MSLSTHEFELVECHFLFAIIGYFSNICYQYTYNDSNDIMYHFNYLCMFPGESVGLGEVLPAGARDAAALRQGGRGRRGAAPVCAAAPAAVLTAPPPCLLAAVPARLPAAPPPRLLAAAALGCLDHVGQLTLRTSTHTERSQLDKLMVPPPSVPLHSHRLVHKTTNFPLATCYW